MFSNTLSRINLSRVLTLSLWVFAAILASIVLHVIIHTNSYSFFTVRFWEENSEWIRNVSLVFAVIIGMFLAIWRNVVSNVASRALAENARINNDNLLISLRVHSGNLYLDCMKNLANHEKEKSIVILHSIIALGRFLDNPDSEEYELAVFALTRFLGEIAPYNPRNCENGYLLSEKRKMERDAVLSVLKKCNADKAAHGTAHMNLANLDLEEAELFGFDLKNTDLTGSNLKGVKLDSADLSMVTLIGVNLEKAHLSKANLENADLYKANISMARMDGANLKNADLGRASLEATYLMESDFQGAKLGNTNFRNAVLTNAGFEDAWLSEANFEGVVGLTVKQLSKANTLYGVESLPSHIEAELRKEHAELFREPGGFDFEEV